jgi:hypothetical protein
MRVSTFAELVVPGAIDDVFAYATDPKRIAELFRGWGPIPAIEAMIVHGEGPTTVGTTRTIRNSDGTTLDEEVIEHAPPHRHAYRLYGDFQGLVRMMVREGRGAWTYTQRDAPGGPPATSVRWDYEFELRSPAWIIVAGPLMKIAFFRAQRRCLERLRDAFSDAR